MHFVISGTWGLTDPTRAMLPFMLLVLPLNEPTTNTDAEAS
jgi:hypothetical protein